jgi:hypothetical protein
MATAKQTEIPGTERPRIKQIDDAADLYRELRDKRMKALEKEIEAQDALQKVLHKHEEKLTDRDEDGNPLYVLEDGEECAVLMRSEEKAKVKKYKAAKVSGE